MQLLALDLICRARPAPRDNSIEDGYVFTHGYVRASGRAWMEYSNSYIEGLLHLNERERKRIFLNSVEFLYIRV